jgi:aminopeptidase-like protein
MGPRSIKGEDAYSLAVELWPINRSLNTVGTSQTIQRLIQDFKKNSRIYRFRSGKKVADWVVPKRWNVTKAYVETLDGQRLIDWEKNNLHLVSYSIGINKIISKKELFENLHFDPSNPGSIPYRTSYYARKWGFCIAANDLKRFVDDSYHVVIDSNFTNHPMEIGELYFKGRSNKEVVFSTYVCHPSMANNELSGPVVLHSIAKYLSSLNTFYSYRILFLPETIGAIALLTRNLRSLRKRVLAGFVVTCVGDSKEWSFIESRSGITLADKIGKRVLNQSKINFKEYTFLDRGSDERQYCSPGVDLPFASITRSKYGTYPEYHSSADDLDLISPEGLESSIELYIKIIEEFENNSIYKSDFIGEPMYSKYLLRNSTGAGSLSDSDRNVSNIVALSDGSSDITEIANRLNLSKEYLEDQINKLVKFGILKKVC